MKLRILSASLAAFLLLLVPSAQARAASKADAYFGYSRAGANLYAPNTSGMNGWQAAFQVKAISVLGVEGDVSHYSQSPSGFSERVTNVMFGPRATVGLAGFSVFAHALAGLAFESATVTTFPSTSYTAASLAVGGGADFPLVSRAQAARNRRLPGQQQSAVIRLRGSRALSHWRRRRLPLLARGPNASGRFRSSIGKQQPQIRWPSLPPSALGRRRSPSRRAYRPQQVWAPIAAPPGP